MGGRASGSGFDYQAAANAYVLAHIIAGRPLHFIGDNDCPAALSAETKGPGDDMLIELVDGRRIEVQVKRGLNRAKLWDDLLALCAGLAEDGKLHGVLLVDSSTSPTIRNDLKGDLERLRGGRRDQLKEITLDFLSRLNEHGLPDLSRIGLFIVEKRLDETDADRSLAMTALETVIERPQDARAAWNALYVHGAQIIKNAGRLDGMRLLNILGSNIHLRKDANSTLVLAKRYIDWTAEDTSTYTAPGIRRPLSILRVWAPVRARIVDETVEVTAADTAAGQVAAYHEYGAAEIDERDPQVFQAEYTTELRGNVLLTGGPASGKSLLLQRIAHDLASMGIVPVQVRLADVARAARETGQFGGALAAAACRESGLTTEGMEHVLPTAAFLLADGLDECGDDRLYIVDRLQSWALGHPRCRIVVASRRIGRWRGLFPGWREVELVPLTSDDIVKHAHALLSYASVDAPTQRAAENALRLHAENPPLAPVLARSPLLIDFATALTLNGIEPGRRRTEIYENMLLLMQRRLPHDRPAPTTVGDSLAMAILEALALELQQSPGIPYRTLVPLVGAHARAGMPGFSQLEACMHAESAISFWEGRRVLERLHTDIDETVEFVHLSLREYAAARYTASLSDHELLDWLDSAGDKLDQREVITMAAGVGRADAIVRRLVVRAREQDEDHLFLTLALSAATEGHLDPSTAMMLAKMLRSQLDADDAHAVLALLHAAVPFVMAHPAAALPVIEDLIRDSRPWVRLAALRLVLAAGPERVDTSTIVGFVQDKFAPEEWLGARQAAEVVTHSTSDNVVYPALGRPEQGEVVTLAVCALLDREETRGDAELFRGILKDACVNVSTDKKVRRLLLQAGFQTLVDEHDGDRFRRVFTRAYAESRQGAMIRESEAINMLARTVGDSKGNEDVPWPSDRLVRVAKLLAGMDWPRAPVAEWSDVTSLGDPEAACHVIQQIVEILGVNPRSLSEELEWISNNFEEFWAPPRESGIISALPNVPLDPVWSRADQSPESIALLRRALDHPARVVSDSAAAILFGLGHLEYKDSPKHRLLMYEKF